MLEVDTPSQRSQVDQHGCQPGPAPVLGVGPLQHPLHIGAAGAHGGASPAGADVIPLGQPVLLALLGDWEHRERVLPVGYRHRGRAW